MTGRIVCIEKDGLKAKNRVRAAEAQSDVEKQTLDYQVITLKSRQEQAYAEMQKQLAMVQFYEDSGLRQESDILIL